MVPGGSEVPSRSDAKRRIDYFLAEVASGESMEALRRVVRTCHDLNNAVTHSSSTTRPMALAAAQATILVVRTLEELWNESEPF